MVIIPVPANRDAGRPQRPTASDYRHEDSKKGNFFVFDNRLQLSDDEKYHIENSIDHHIIDAGETPVTFAASAGPPGEGYLIAIRKTSAKRDFVLIRKATRAEADAMFGTVRRRKKRDPRREISRRLVEVERALHHLPPPPASVIIRCLWMVGCTGKLSKRSGHWPRRFKPNNLAPQRSRRRPAC
jgi:hypothetical protein